METSQAANLKDQEALLQRSAKQRYLKREILDKGLDPTLFSELLSQNQDKGQNIDNWEFDELQEMVFKFQHIQDVLSLQKIDPNQSSIETPPTSSRSSKFVVDPYLQLGSEMGSEEDWEYDFESPRPSLFRPGTVKAHPSLKVVPVSQCHVTVLNQHLGRLKVELEQPQVVQSKEYFLLTYNYLHLTIKTQPLGWQVKRQESDFYLIRRLLVVKYPHLVVPPLPAKMEIKFTNKSIDKRKKYLQRFINAVVKSQEMCTYPFLVEFLKIQHRDLKKFQNLLKQEEQSLLKTRNPLKPKLADICSMSETIDTALLPDSLSFQPLKFLELYEANLKGILLESKVVKAKSIELEELYLKMQNILFNLSQMYGNVQSLNELEVFANVSKVVGSQGFVFQQQVETIVNSIKYIKYEQDYITPIRELQNKKEYTQQKFLRATKQLFKKIEKIKEQLGTENSTHITPEKINCLLPVESREVERSNQLMNFFSNQLLAEVRRIQGHVEHAGLQETLMCMIKKMCEHQNQDHILWSQLVNSLEKIEFKEQE